MGPGKNRIASVLIVCGASDGLDEMFDHPSRELMAFTLASHILLVPFGVALPFITLVIHYRGLRRGDPVARKRARRWAAVMAVQCVVDLLTCVVVSRLAGRLFGRRAAIAALWLAALCPFTANYVAAPLTETLSLACIAIAFYALERWRTTELGVNRWA